MSTIEDIEKHVENFKGLIYKRPEHVHIPTVWKRFEGKTPGPDGTYPKFRIQDVTDDWLDEIFECAQIFAEEAQGAEAFFKTGPEQYGKMFKGLWRVMIKDRVALMCLTDDEGAPRLAGFQINEVGTKLRTEKDCSKIIGNELSELLYGFMILRKEYNIFEKFGVAAYMDAWGLFVKAEFRNQGIGYHIQHAKIPLCKALGIKVMANSFASEIASHAAAKVGFDLFLKKPKNEVSQNITREVFKEFSAINRYFTFMGMKVE